MYNSKNFKIFNKVMWPIRILALAYPLYMLGELWNILIALGYLSIVIGLVLLLYWWADKYEQKNIKIYCEERLKKKLKTTEI